MIGNFTATLKEIEFQFMTMNAKRLQLFQVYVMYEGSKLRFHMQRNNEGGFYITDVHHCAQSYRQFEQELRATIIEYGKSINAD